MHKIGVISDTHGMLRPEVMAALKECEVILHGGDINKKKILDELEEIAPVYAVRGNNDKEWAEYLPETRALKLFGMNIFMVHNKKMIPADLQETNIVIYGHSHKYEERYADGRFYLNPGSCGPRRFTQPITMAVITVEEKNLKIEKIEIPHLQKKGKESEGNESEKLPENLREIVSAVMRETDQGKSIRQIAKRQGISEALAEQICRLYLTHPGVDTDGILRKMGL